LTDPVTREVAELFNLGYEVLLQVLARFFTHTDGSVAASICLARRSHGVNGACLDDHVGVPPVIGSHHEPPGM
jgi:hypothetical protein